MKILHLIYDHINNPWVGGGGAARVYEIYKRLSLKGHSICVVSSRYPQAKDYSEGSLTMKFVGLDKNYVLSVFSYTLCANIYLKNNYNKYDIIIEDFPAPWNPLFSMRIKNKPVILQIQNYLGKEVLKQYGICGFPFYLVEKFYAKLFKKWIVVSGSLNKRFSVEGKIIPNAVKQEQINIDNADGNYLAFLGRINIYQKGLDVLLKAFVRCSIKTNLNIAGNGKDSNAFLNLIKGRNNIDWVGRVEDKKKAAFIKNALALIVPSRYEGQGIVILEAAALGKPVIVSDIPELRYAVEAGFGIAFKSGDAFDLAKKIEFLLANEGLRKEMGKKAREYAKGFTWDRIADEYEGFLMKTVVELTRCNV